MKIIESIMWKKKKMFAWALLKMTKVNDLSQWVYFGKANYYWVRFRLIVFSSFKFSWHDKSWKLLGIWATCLSDIGWKWKQSILISGHMVLFAIRCCDYIYNFKVSFSLSVLFLFLFYSMEHVIIDFQNKLMPICFHFHSPLFFFLFWINLFESNTTEISNNTAQNKAGNYVVLILFLESHR